ncbi:hypothetical protein BDR06DRAFT_491735 [Suillus hirtellus]|nr:hypothetical protein BDR06DRAFT_491735 [Suillus hirtellus]
MLNMLKVLRRPGLGFGCYSFSDWSSFVVSLHSCEDDSLASPNSPHADHDEVLVSPISDVPQGDHLPPIPRELDDAEQTSVLEATLTDHTQKGELRIDQSSPADTVYSGTSVANDTGPRKRHKLSMKALSIRSNRSTSLSGTRDRHALWGRIRSLFSLRTPQNAERIRPILLHSNQN